MTVTIISIAAGGPPGKVAEAELHFGAGDGVLAGLKLVGFTVWERPRSHEHHVTFPAREYAVHGERRTVALLRPISVVGAQERLRDLVLEAYAAHESRT